MEFRLSTPLKLLGIAILYFISARLGLLISFGNTNATPVWPPSGIAVAFLLIWGYRAAPSIWAGAFVANLVVFLGNGAADNTMLITISATIATGNLLEAAVARYLFIRIIGLKLFFTKYQQVFWFFLIAFPAAMVSSVVGITSLYVAAIINFGEIGYTWQTWFLGDVSGIVVLSPFILFMADKKHPERSFVGVEFWLNFLMILAVAWYIFIDQDGIGDVRLKSYVMVPFLMWAGFRFSQREMAGVLLLVSTIIIIGTVSGSGPFMGRDLNQALLELQTYISLISLSFLALSAILFNQRRIHAQVEESKLKLEERVMERTQALTGKIAQLEKTEAELAVIQEEFIKACDIAHLGHFQWDVLNDKLYWSDQVYQIFGIDKGSTVANLAMYNSRLHPADVNMIFETIQNALKDHQPYSMVHRIVQQNSGQVRWIQSKGNVVLDSEGAVSQLRGTVLDVTELKQKEEFTNHLAAIIEHSADAVMSMSVEGTIMSWNSAAENLFGYCSDEIIGENVFQKLHGKDQDQLKDRVAKVRQGDVVNVEDLIQHRNGHQITIWITYSPIRDVDKNVSGISIIMRDMTERKTQEDHRFKLIVDSAPNVMLLVNQEGRIEIVNSQAEKLFGYAQTELVGKTIEMLVPDRFRSQFANCARIKSVQRNSDLFALHKDGSEIPVEIELNPIDTAEGTIVLAAITDVTERKRLEEARHEQEVVQETVRLKDQFMANMSHEIRTPMNAIVGFTDLLDRTDLRPEQREYLSAIKSSGINLLTIINDILDLSKIHSGKIHVERTPMSVLDIGHNICEIFGQKARDKGLELSCMEFPIKPVMVWGDPVRLSQILMNLISNALKFTEKGSVEVGMKVIHETSSKQTLEFRVRDTGIGIKKSIIDNIFDRFTQASSDTTRKYGGTGLGLSIVKGLIDIQGGEITVESTEGQGSTFTFRLTYDRYVDPDQHFLKFNEPAAANLNSAPIAGLRILLVEDNRLNQKLATTVLTQAGCSVDLAETGQEAVDKVKEAEYDAILMDIQMPVMDGYKATQVIRTELLMQLPIIAMTAHAMAGERDKCLSLGMNEYLSKPFQREQLIQIIFETVSRVHS